MESLDQKIQNFDLGSEQDTENDDYSCMEEYFLDQCRAGDMEEFKLCLQEKVDIQWTDKNQNNCIHMATANGHLHILEEIFKILDDLPQEIQTKMINHQNGDGNTPLHWAVINNKIEIVKFLVDKNADVNLNNHLKKVPLEEALDLQLFEIGEIFAHLTKDDLDKYKDLENFQVQNNDNEEVDLNVKQEDETQ